MSSINRKAQILLIVLLWAVLEIVVVYNTEKVFSTLNTEELRISITGEKNSLSLGTDIGILEIKSGNERFDLAEIGFNNGWDSYDGVLIVSQTQNGGAIINIPNYKDTIITFKKNQYAGIVELSRNNWVEPLDLYSEQETTFEYLIEASEQWGARIVIFAFLEGLILFGFLYFFLIVYPEKNGRLNAIVWLHNQIVKSPILFANHLIILLFFLLMLRYGGTISLWADDLATIGFVQQGEDIQTIVDRVLEETRYNPPLFYVFAYIWLRIAPYGTIFLKLPSIIFCCIGAWFCGRTMALLTNERNSLFATIIVASSWYLVDFAAYTFRSYGLLFAFSAGLCYIYAKRRLEPDSVSYHIGYSILLILLLYTNYISILIFSSFLLCDFVLYTRKQVSFKFSYSYIGAGVLFLPLLVYAFQEMVDSHKSFWPIVPSVHDLFATFELIFSNHLCLIILFMVGVCVSVLPDILIGQSKFFSVSNQKRSIVIAFSVCFVFVLLFSYFYSTKINPNGSIFVSRYFVSILAPGVIVVTVALCLVLNMIITNDNNCNNLSFIICILLVYFGLSYFQVKQIAIFPGAMDEPVEQTIEWIYGHKKAHEDSSAICIGTYQDGLYYYATKGLKRPNLNFISQIDSTNWQKYDTVFVSPMHSDFSSEMWGVLNDNYAMIENKDELRVSVYYRKR